MSCSKIISLIKKGKSRKIQSILKNNFYTTVDTSGATLLHYCAEYENKEVAQYLLDENCYDINAKDSAGNTPLMIAVRKVNKDIIHIFLAAGADMMILNKENKTALHMVYEEKHFRPGIGKLFFYKLCKKYSTNAAIAQALINAGCRLYQAICFSDAKIIKCMLKLGLSAYSMQSMSKQTALHVSVAVNNASIVKILLKYSLKCDIEYSGINCYEKVSSLAKPQDDEMFKLTLENHFFPSDVTEESKYLVRYSTAYSGVKVAQYSLNRQCYVNAKDLVGTTPLMIAVKNKNKQIIKILLTAGADIMILNNENKSPLHMLCDETIFSPEIGELLFFELCKNLSSYEERAQTLLDAGCHLYQACYFKSAKIVEYLLEQGVPIGFVHPQTKQSALHVAVSLEDIDTVKVLLKYNANVIATDIHGATPLFFIYQSGLKHTREKIEILKVLLDLEVSSTPHDSLGLFQICPILKYGNREAIHIVLQSNIDFEAKSEDNGMSVLHYLAFNTNPGIFRELQPYYNMCNVNITDRSGMTPLHIAAMCSNVEMIQFLLNQGAIPNCVHTEHGFTPLYYSYANFKPDYKNHFSQCVELLLQNDTNSQLIFTDRNNTEITIFDVAETTNSLNKTKPVIAHLAILEKLGTPFAEIVFMKINSHPQLKQYFIRCQKFIKTKIFGSLTLFQLLISNEKKMSQYSDNEELLLILTRLRYKQNLKFFYTFYYNILETRFKKGIEYSRFLDKIAGVICNICENRFDRAHLVTKKIMDYLDHESLCQLYELSEKVNTYK